MTKDIGLSIVTCMAPPAALIEFARACPASPGLLAKATAKGLRGDVAAIACGVMTRVIKALDDAGRLPKRTYARAKCLETALEACRPPMADALRLAMVSCPVDGRAMLRLWSEVCEPGERGAMFDLLRPGEVQNILVGGVDNT